MNRAWYENFPTDLEKDGPFSICQQFRSIHHPETQAAERLQLLYRASRYLASWHPEAQNGWTEDFKAAESLCHGFRLHPQEAFQLLRCEFNPRLRNSLSDRDLWNVIQARAGTACSREGGWLNNPGKQCHRMLPKAPQWMVGRTDAMFWVPDPEIGNHWLEKVARQASSQVSNFATRILSLRSWQEHGNTRGEPPLQDHPLLECEIAIALGVSNSEVNDFFFKLVASKLIVTMDLRHVPGVYSEVFVPNCFGEGNA